MAGLGVAKAGDVTASVGTTYFGTATSGAWTAAGPVTETTYSFLTIQGAAVVHQASCSFSFSGSDGTNAVTGASSVTLTASSTTLQKGSTFVLRDGDSAQDIYGNTLTVSAPNILTSD